MAADNEELEQLRLQLEEVMPEIPARFWPNLETDYQLTRALINKRTKFVTFCKLRAVKKIEIKNAPSHVKNFGSFY